MANNFSSMLRGSFVRVRGAREHNLHDIDVDIPRDKLVVFTGISGSGKSSLAFGTIYAEAQRRYFESVAPYARRLIEQVGVPDVDSIDGLPPAVALQQQRGIPGARSSVGSITTLSSLIRLLYSRAGSYPPRQPMLYAEDFSPNTAQGACANCHGLGMVFQVTEQSMVPDDTLTIRERAIAAWPPAWHGQNLRDILTTLGHDVDVPWRELPKKTREWILFTDEQPTVPVFAGWSLKEVRAAVRANAEPSYMGTFTSARRYVLHTYATTQSALMKRRVARFMIGTVCPVCAGKRLKKEALSVTFAGLDISEVSRLPLSEVARVLKPASEDVFDRIDASDGNGATRASTATISRSASREAVNLRVAAGGSAHRGAPDVRRTVNLSAEKRLAAQRLAAEAVERIEALQALGLGYLSMERSTPTLSSGELQRLRLATQIRANLFGVVYVLDEPTAGLHPKDSEALFAALVALKAAGNSVFIVEHDLDMMRRADWLVEVGPGAGIDGGQILYSGPPAGLRDVPDSHTARYLFERAPVPESRRRQPAGWLALERISRNNLRELRVRFPLGVLTAVTGVSGAGKSSLVSQALVELVSRHLGQKVESEDGNDSEEVGAHAGTMGLSDEIDGHIAEGGEELRRLIRVDQRPIGRTPRSNLATYTGLFDGVRKLYAATPAARARRYDAGRFSFNVAKGRCETCEGEGFVSVELLFMPSVYAPCPACHGARYNEKTLEIKWREKNIAEVLQMTVDDACAFFAKEASVSRPLQLLQDIGLGYLRLGQPATELSGGEAQRIKLASELQRPARSGSLYVLDEPTTGLHPADIDKLMAQLQGLVDAGSSVVVVEHDARVVAEADWIIELGPGAGGDGGRIVFEGAPAGLHR